MTRKDFLRFLFFKVFLFVFLFAVFGIERAFAKTKKAKNSKKKKKTKVKRTRKNRRSRKSKKRRVARFKYKRGGPDIRVLTKDSNFKELPDNGVSPVEALIVPSSLLTN